MKTAILGTAKGIFVVDAVSGASLGGAGRTQRATPLARERTLRGRLDRRLLPIGRRRAFVAAERNRRPRSLGRGRGARGSLDALRRHRAGRALPLARRRRLLDGDRRIPDSARLHRVVRAGHASSPGPRAAIVLDPADPLRLVVGVEVRRGAQRGRRAHLDDEPPGGNPDLLITSWRRPDQPGVLFASTGFGRIDRSEPMEQRIAGMFRSDDHGKSWRFQWTGMTPPYTRPLCIDSRQPYAVTVGSSPTAFSAARGRGRREGDALPVRRWRRDVALARGCRPLALARLSSTRWRPIRMPPATSLAGTDTGELWRVSPRRAGH